MDITARQALFAWLIVFVILALIFIWWGLRRWSGIVLALLVALIVLCLIYPFKIVNGMYIMQSEDKVVCAILLITLIILILYVICKAFWDVNPSCSTSYYSPAYNPYLKY